MDTQPGVTIERVRAATELRRIGHAIVGHDVTEETFSALADAVAQFASQIEAGPVRNRATLLDRSREDASPLGEPPDHGEPMSHFPDCVVSGLANPMGIAIEVRRDHDDAVAEVVLGAAFEGAPGRAHGGVVAAIFDDVMGYQLSILKIPAFTGKITVTYRALTPVGVPLVFRARFDRREGRRLYLSAMARTRDNGSLVAEASATFIVISIDRFLRNSREGAE
ncbi:MAG: PaaI family thioesterase [Acidimicrobiales bacterium]